VKIVGKGHLSGRHHSAWCERPFTPNDQCECRYHLRARGVSTWLTPLLVRNIMALAWIRYYFEVDQALVGCINSSSLCRAFPALLAAESTTCWVICDSRSIASFG
jgi:hypothetical protein